MGKKILAICASPRKNGNCETLVRAFMRGAEENGNEIRAYFASETKIEPCLACGMCYQTGKPCVQKDAINEIIPVFLEADIVLLASPFYFHNFSAQMYAFINRLYAIGNTNDHVYPKKDVILMVSSHSDREEDFEPLFAQYNNMLIGYMGWREIGRVMAHTYSERGEVAGTDFEKQAEELGKSIR